MPNKHRKQPHGELGASPQLEWWNAGIIGSGIMKYWVNGKICVDDKIIMANILLKTNLPEFHYSILEARVQASKNVLYFHKVVEIPKCLINEIVICRVFFHQGSHQLPGYWLHSPPWQRVENSLDFAGITLNCDRFF